MKLFRKTRKRVLTILLFTFAILLLAVTGYLQHPKFGQAPRGARLERIKRSPHYRDGAFHNDSETPTFSPGHSFWGELVNSIVTHYPDLRPAGAIPSVKTDLSNIPIDSTAVVWLGHSTCFIQIHGKRILVDPVFSKYASPIPGSVGAFAGTTSYQASDMPHIDYILISHDHYDHLDYETMRALKDKTTKVICGLGVGAHLECWGYHEDQIAEKDWYEDETINSGLTLYATPARHKSGRLFRQNNTLWLSFVLQAAEATLYISGDGGYDRHFTDIGKRFGPIDLAIMENGQYDSAWHYVHPLPEEVWLAARDLKAKKILPVHHSKFALARHPWYGPLRAVTEAAAHNSIPVLTPKIGQPVTPWGTTNAASRWWEAIQ